MLINQYLGNGRKAKSCLLTLVASGFISGLVGCANLEADELILKQGDFILDCRIEIIYYRADLSEPWQVAVRDNDDNNRKYYYAQMEKDGTGILTLPKNRIYRLKADAKAKTISIRPYK